MDPVIEARMLAKIATMTSIEDLRSVLKNAKDKSEAVCTAAFDRIVHVSASDRMDPVARACWKMVYTIEELRRRAGRKVWRMNHLRPKIEREGERVALAYCARNRTDGFQEVLDYGLPQYTAEAIVLAHPTAFPEEDLRAIAWNRLTEAGVDINVLKSESAFVQRTVDDA